MSRIKAHNKVYLVSSEGVANLNRYLQKLLLTLYCFNSICLTTVTSANRSHLRLFITGQPIGPGSPVPSSCKCLINPRYPFRPKKPKRRFRAVIRISLFVARCYPVVFWASHRRKLSSRYLNHPSHGCHCYVITDVVASATPTCLVVTMQLNLITGPPP